MKTLSRRHFLRGLGGVALALPWCASLQPRSAWGQPDGSRHRFLVVVRAGNGIVQASSDGSGERFWPRALGTLSSAALGGANADRATSVLAAFAPRLLMVKNVKLPFARNSCGHAEAIPQVLTAAPHTGGSGNAPLALGRSVDWHVTEKLEGPGRAPLTFMAGPRGAYIGNALSWSGPRQRAAAENSPLSAWMRLTGLSNAPPELQQQVATRRKSVNDLVRAQLRALLARPELGAHDRRRLTQHLEAVRDMELQMTCDLEAGQAAAIQALGAPERNDARPEVVRQFMDLVAWAFNCRLAHAATLQVGHGNDGTQYFLDGTKLPSFHWISHRIYADGASGEPIPDAAELHHRLDRLQLSLYRHLLERLDGYASPYGGTLLDDCAAAWTNDLGSGPSHDANTTPWIIAGGAGGTLRTGQVVDHGRKPVNQVLNTLINAVGLRKADGSPTDDFGDASLPGGVVAGALAG